MALYTARARAQILSLLRHYVDRDRPEAARKLIDAVRRGMRSMDQGPPHGRPYPGNWRHLENHGIRWFIVHRYWFGYVSVDGTPVVTNVLYDRANMPARIEPVGPPVPFDEG